MRIEYSIATDTTIAGLVERVQTAINEGWKISGGVTHGGYCWAQALYRELGESAD